jgi:hypothetical protein
MRWLAATVLVPVLVVISATVPSRGRADSAALTLMAAVPAHAMEQNPSDAQLSGGAAADAVPRPGLRPDPGLQRLGAREPSATPTS